jgi:hypothetical protein
MLAVMSYLVTLSLLMARHCCVAQNIVEVAYSLDEELPVGTRVGDVIRDANLTSLYDSDVIGRLQFGFFRQRSTDFAIDESSGVISTSGRIDRDVICPGSEVCLTRFDIALYPVNYFRIVRVTVAILDRNDNAPTFPDRKLKLDVLESAPPGTAIPLPVVAADPDSPPFSVRTYRLTAVDDRAADHFKLVHDRRKDGSTDIRLVVTGALDREAVDRYQLKVSAVDGGSPGLTGTVDIIIRFIRF